MLLKPFGKDSLSSQWWWHFGKKLRGKRFSRRFSHFNICTLWTIGFFSPLWLIAKRCLDETALLYLRLHLFCISRKYSVNTVLLHLFLIDFWQSCAVLLVLNFETSEQWKCSSGTSTREKSTTTRRPWRLLRWVFHLVVCIWRLGLSDWVFISFTTITKPPSGKDTVQLQWKITASPLLYRSYLFLLCDFAGHLSVYPICVRMLSREHLEGIFFRSGWNVHLQLTVKVTQTTHPFNTCQWKKKNQESLKGISSILAKALTWTQGYTICFFSVVRVSNVFLSLLVIVQEFIVTQCLMSIL